MTAPLKILVVDDQEINLELARCILQADGIDVLCADGADGARAALLNSLPDVILMDIQMPGTDGLDLTREIKSNPAYTHIPVIAFTAYAMHGDEARFMAAGCNGYISKPIEVGLFAAQVRALARPS